MTRANLRVTGVVGLAMWLGAAAASAQEAAVPFVSSVRNAPPAARARISRLITLKYASLPEEVAALLIRERPNFFTDIQPDLDRLVATRYPGLREYVEGEVGAAPGMQAALGELIATKYPGIMAEIKALPPGPDLTGRAAALLRTKHPELMRDVVAMLHDKFPALIVEVEKKVQAKYPAFIADAGSVVLMKYPDLTGKITVMVMAKHPGLMGEVQAILAHPAQPLEGTETETPAPELLLPESAPAPTPGAAPAPKP